MMYDKLAALERRFDDLTNKLGDPAVLSKPAELKKLAKERSEIEALVATYRDYKIVEKEITGHQEVLAGSDAELRELAREELPALEKRLAGLDEQLKLLLVPRDPNDDRNILLEVRAGTGGEEAALFAAEIFRMYLRYAERTRWKVELLSSNATGIGGLKEAIALFSGEGAYSRLKYESGVHRVQRVPRTEGSGRIHTSTVTVAVMPEAEEVDVQIDEDKDLRIDVFRASGHGGQSVNTTDSAVRITHLPTNLVVTCQDEKSQHKNRAKAMKILRARLLDAKRAAEDAKRSANRRSQVGTGDRSEKIRTYNFPQSRVTDHRIGFTTHQLQDLLDGGLDELITACRTSFQAALLEQQSEAHSQEN